MSAEEEPTNPPPQEEAQPTTTTTEPEEPAEQTATEEQKEEEQPAATADEEKPAAEPAKEETPAATEQEDIKPEEPAEQPEEPAKEADETKETEPQPADVKGDEPKKTEEEDTAEKDDEAPAKKEDEAEKKEEPKPVDKGPQRVKPAPKPQPKPQSRFATSTANSNAKKDQALRAQHRERYTRHTDISQRYKPGAPPPQYKSGPEMPEDVQAMSKMTASQRVKAAYAELKADKKRTPSSTFKSRTPRTSYGLTLDKPEPNKASMQRDRMLNERTRTLRENIEKQQMSSSNSDAHRYQRTSSWARDTVTRGTYNFNWQQFPEATPKRHIDPSPGPGAYTSKLFFMGGK